MTKHSIFRTIAKATLATIAAASFGAMVAATIGGVVGVVSLTNGVSIMLLCGVSLVGSLLASVEI